MYRCLPKEQQGAKPYAVSFYVKGNASATYTCELEDGDNSRRVAKEFSGDYRLDKT